MLRSLLGIIHASVLLPRPSVHLLHVAGLAVSIFVTLAVVACVCLRLLAAALYYGWVERCGMLPRYGVSPVVHLWSKWGVTTPHTCCVGVWVV